MRINHYTNFEEIDLSKIKFPEIYESHSDNVQIFVEDKRAVDKETGIELKDDLFLKYIDSIGVPSGLLGEDDKDYNSSLNNVINYLNRKNKRKIYLAQKDNANDFIITDGDLPLNFRENIQLFLEAASDLKSVDYDIERIKIYDSLFPQISIELTYNEKFDALKDFSDFWKIGIGIDYSVINYVISPFLERLICSNGARLREGSRYGNIYKKRNFPSYLPVILKNLVERNFINTREELKSRIINKSIQNKNSTASINEFLSIYRNLLSNFNENFKQDSEKYFLIDRLSAEYGEDILSINPNVTRNMSCGLSRYQLYNMATNILTHKPEYHVNENTSREVGFNLNKFFFSDPEFVEVKSKPIKYPEIPELI